MGSLCVDPQHIQGSPRSAELRIHTQPATHSLFIHLPTEGHLGCFQVWVIVNEAATNIRVQVFVWT